MTDRRRVAAHLVLAAGLGLGLHLWVAGATDPVPDEAWYGLWSRHPGLAYPDHPPAVAWLVAGARILAGEGTLALRLPALAAGVLVPWLLAAAAGALAGPRAAVRAVWLASATLFLHVLGIVVTPDVPLVLAWSAALAGAALVVRRGGVGRWGLLALGALAGGALLSKLHGWLLLAGVIGGLGASGVVPLRRLPWILAGALAVWAPAGWAALAAPGASDAAFQLARLRPVGVPGAHLPGLVAGQVALLTPGVAVPAALWLRGALRRRGPGDRLLLALALPTLVAFAGVALVRPVEANWPAPGWLAVVVGVAVQGLGGRGRAVAAGSVPLVLAAHLLAVTGLPEGAPVRDPAARLHGWAALGPFLEERCGDGEVVAEGYWLGAEARLWAPACEVRILDGRRAAWLSAAGLGASEAAEGALVIHRAGRAVPVPAGCAVVPAGALEAGGRSLRAGRVRCGRASTRRLDDTARRSAPP